MIRAKIQKKMSLAQKMKKKYAHFIFCKIFQIVKIHEIDKLNFEGKWWNVGHSSFGVLIFLTIF